MIHLGFPDLIRSDLSACVDPQSSIAPAKFHRVRINRLHASQNAAALLFDLETVDIRLSGDSIQRILVVGCSE
jgi:hypothetical protein